MRIFIINLAIVAFMSACQSQTTTPKSKDCHEVVVAEVLQANSYTYLKLTENDSAHWFAVPKMQAEVGETYFYKGGFLMKDFVSKDLDRTFPEVYFLDRISKEPIIEKEGVGSLATAQQEGTAPQNMSEEETANHKVILKEILQATKYTYFRVDENGIESWLALPKAEGVIGKTYYYFGGALMTKFESKDLNRTFDEVYFITGVSEQPINSGVQDPNLPHTANTTSELVKEIKVEPAKDGITLEKLYSSKATFAGKTVKIKGEITKFSAQIMGKNWVHIQDGTLSGDNIDLTVTTSTTHNVGDIVIVEGKITLDKDFGAGYFYKVIMEDAKIIKQ